MPDVVVAPTRDDVLRARDTIGDRLPRTPLLGNRTIGARLKCELFQRTGSFKARGALNKISSLSADEKARGVIAISAGNHAQAVAFAAARRGSTRWSSCGTERPQQKIAATRGYGAAVDLEASGPGDAFDRLERAGRGNRPDARRIRSTTRSSSQGRAPSVSRSRRTRPTPTRSSFPSAAAG